MRCLAAALLAALPLAAWGGCVPAPISPSDIVGAASAEHAFSAQSGYTVQTYGSYTRAASIPESGIHAPALGDGETLRFGKTDAALSFLVDPRDPPTSGSRRSEISFGKNIEPGKVYWIAFSVYVHDWGRLDPRDAALFGTQLHSGRDGIGLGPAFSLYTSRGGRKFYVQASWNTEEMPERRNTGRARYGEHDIPFGRWTDFVLRFRQRAPGAGLLQVWMDGRQIVDHRGDLGYNTPGYNDYVKFGYYNWTDAMNSPRKVWLRSPTIVADPTGDTYQHTQLRALLGCERAEPARSASGRTKHPE
jgi:Polysaccharide lyase